MSLFFCSSFSEVFFIPSPFAVGLFRLLHCVKRCCQPWKTSFHRKAGPWILPWKGGDFYSEHRLNLAYGRQHLPLQWWKGVTDRGRGHRCKFRREEQKSCRHIHSFSYTTSRESNGAGGSLRERYLQYRKTTECLSTLLPGKSSGFFGRQQVVSQ